MKFKVGDTVKIVCADKETSSHSTRNKIGQVGKITKFSGTSNMPYSIYFEDDNWTLNFMEKEIEKVTTKGQLLFSFME